MLEGQGKMISTFIVNRQCRWKVHEAEYRPGFYRGLENKFESGLGKNHGSPGDYLRIIGQVILGQWGIRFEIAMMDF